MEPVSLEAIEARDALSKGKTFVKGITHGGLRIALLRHKADAWLTFARGEDGGVALRTSLLTPDSDISAGETGVDGLLLEWEATSELGTFRAELRGEDTGLEHFATGSLSNRAERCISPIYRATLSPAAETATR